MSRELIERVKSEDPGFRIEAERGIAQSIPPTPGQRFEGVAFSPRGDTLAIAASEGNALFLFRRKADGRFEDQPCSTISGAGSGLDYPHDVSFAASGDSELLAVAQRTGSICIYEKRKDAEHYGPVPVCEIRGPGSKLEFSDAVAFVPPENQYLAACNLSAGKLTFYRRTPGPSVNFTSEPVFELQHPSIHGPDGLAFSDCGRWLAIANHGSHTVSIFERSGAPGKPIKYGPEPVTVLDEPRLRCPHSVAFTPQTNHLIVTNAGANYFSVYKPRREGADGTRWSPIPVLRQTVGPESIFREVNARNKLEGGPKGIAVHDNKVAICSPEHGIKIYSYSANTAH
jgi:6-phosphogluconolactonase (cycloisomerase 2 family)